jgi:hypothetical protein
MNTIRKDNWEDLCELLGTIPIKRFWWNSIRVQNRKDCLLLQNNKCYVPLIFFSFLLVTVLFDTHFALADILLCVFLSSILLFLIRIFFFHAFPFTHKIVCDHKTDRVYIFFRHQWFCKSMSFPKDKIIPVLRFRFDYMDSPPPPGTLALTLEHKDYPQYFYPFYADNNKGSLMPAFEALSGFFPDSIDETIELADLSTSLPNLVDQSALTKDKMPQTLRIFRQKKVSLALFEWKNSLGENITNFFYILLYLFLASLVLVPTLQISKENIRVWYFSVPFIIIVTCIFGTLVCCKKDKYIFLDWSQNRLTASRFRIFPLRKTICSLDDIAFVQLCSIWRTVHDTGKLNFTDTIYELNLILKNNTRMHILGSRNREEVLKTAQQTAAFLNLDILDHLSKAPADDSELNISEEQI